LTAETLLLPHKHIIKIHEKSGNKMKKAIIATAIAAAFISSVALAADPVAKPASPTSLPAKAVTAPGAEKVEQIKNPDFRLAEKKDTYHVVLTLTRTDNTVESFAYDLKDGESTTDKRLTDHRYLKQIDETEGKTPKNTYDFYLTGYTIKVKLAENEKGVSVKYEINLSDDQGLQTLYVNDKPTIESPRLKTLHLQSIIFLAQEDGKFNDKLASSFSAKGDKSEQLNIHVTKN
jgi:hypothetical protein